MNYPIKHWHFSVDDFHRMVETGILREDDRVELLQGEVVCMSPIGSRHAACVDGIYQVLFSLLGSSASVRGQNPVLLDERSEPEPDVAVLKHRKDRYANSLPTPADVLLLVEVADSSLEVDRNVKVPLYAKAGIAEVWIANLNEDHIEVYSAPMGEVYQNLRVVRRGETLSLSNFPQLSIRVDDLLG